MNIYIYRGDAVFFEKNKKRKLPVAGISVGVKEIDLIGSYYWCILWFYLAGGRPSCARAKPLG